MADLVINERDAERLREIAQRENLPIEELVTHMIDAYAAGRRSVETQPSAGDERTEYMTKLYAYARAYWKRVNDAQKLALTDDDLDAQFWCIDPEGIPRLKSEQDQVTVPEDGLSALLESVWQDNPTGEVEEPINYRDILHKEYVQHLMNRMQGNDAQPDTD